MKSYGASDALKAGVCCALVKNATCGRPLRGGKCRVHGEKIYASFVEHHQGKKK